MFPDAYLSLNYLLGMGAWLLFGSLTLVTCLKRRQAARDEPGRKKRIDRLLVLWLLLALATLPELGFALLYDTTDSFSLTNTSTRWYEMHVNANQAGYRDRLEFPPALAAGQRHICFAGDSFTFGHGVADVGDRFSDRVAEALESKQPGRFRVSNVGLPGLELRQLNDLLANDVLKLDPKIDVLVYTIVLNDIEFFDPRTARHYEDINRSQPQFFLFRDTYFYNFLYFRSMQFTQPEVRDYYAYLQESYAGPPWQSMQQALGNLAMICSAHGIELRIVIFPFLHNLGPDYPFLDAHREIAEHCQRIGIPLLDLEPVFRERAGEDLVVNRFDAHPNERAHAIAAEAIEGRLLGDLLGQPQAGVSVPLAD